MSLRMRIRILRHFSTSWICCDKGLSATYPKKKASSGYTFKYYPEDASFAISHICNPSNRLSSEGRGNAQRENIGKLGSIVNLGIVCALRINDDSAIPKLSKLSKLPIFALITRGRRGIKGHKSIMTLYDLCDLRTIGPLRWLRTNVLMVLLVFIVLVLMVLILFSLHPSLPYLHFASQQKNGYPIGVAISRQRQQTKERPSLPCISRT